jgi:hypothetical protein
MRRPKVVDEAVRLALENRRTAQPSSDAEQGMERRAPCSDREENLASSDDLESTAIGHLIALPGTQARSSTGHGNRGHIWLRTVRTASLSESETIRRHQMLINVLLRLAEQATSGDNHHDRAA